MNTFPNSNDQQMVVQRGIIIIAVCTVCIVGIVFFVNSFKQPSNSNPVLSSQMFLPPADILESEVPIVPPASVIHVQENPFSPGDKLDFILHKHHVFFKPQEQP